MNKSVKTHLDLLAPPNKRKANNKMSSKAIRKSYCIHPLPPILEEGMKVVCIRDSINGDPDFQRGSVFNVYGGPYDVLKSSEFMVVINGWTSNREMYVRREDFLLFSIPNLRVVLEDFKEERMDFSNAHFLCSDGWERDEPHHPIHIECFYDMNSYPFKRKDQKSKT